MSYQWREGCQNCDNLKAEYEGRDENTQARLRPSVEMHLKYHDPSLQEMREGVDSVKEL